VYSGTCIHGKIEEVVEKDIEIAFYFDSPA
jgi:hypothetical protein